MRLVGPIILRNVLAAAAVLAFGAHGGALQMHYRTSGEDVYRVGSQPATRITYSGTQVLAVRRDGTGLSFVAQARCERTDPSGTTSERARFVQGMLADGSFEDRVDEDPDFLTILNQPFAVRLDPTTIHDLAELHAPVPFSAASPVGMGSLSGALRPGTPGIIDGRRVVGVEFRANGAVDGPLPGRGASIEGRIRLDGTAYYDERRALLLALDARLTIDGVLSGGHVAAVPVRIVYDRTIKMD
jgi:hypothetical protein